MTADIGSLSKGQFAMSIEKATRRSRSKSIGPGGLDALKDTTGNRRKVWPNDSRGEILLKILSLQHQFLILHLDRF